MRMNLIAPRCERGLSQKSPQKSTALCKSSLRLANVCSREKGAGQTIEPSEVPTAGKRSFVVAPMGSGSVVLYWLSRQFQEDNSTSADDTSVLSLASPVFSVDGPVCRRSQAYTLTSVLSLAFGRSPQINLAIGDAEKIACLVLQHVQYVRSLLLTRLTRLDSRHRHSLPSFRNNRNDVGSRTNATSALSAFHHSRHCLPIRSIVDYTLWNQGCT